MKLSAQITTRNISLDENSESTLRQKIAKLEQFCEDIISCRVLVEVPHRHKQHGIFYNVCIDLTIPGSEILVRREPRQDLSVAIRDAFEAARRQLLRHLSRNRRHIQKAEPTPGLARVTRIYPDRGFGFLSTRDGREVYFDIDSMVKDDFDALELGSFVHFSESGQGASHASAVVQL